MPPRHPPCDRVVPIVLCRTGSRSFSYHPPDSLSFSPRIYLERWLVILSFFCAGNKSDSLYLAFTCSFSAIICSVISPGLWIPYLNLTHYILLNISLSLSGSRFVLIHELQDNSLKSFLDTAIISNFFPSVCIIEQTDIKRFNAVQDRFGSQWLNAIPCKNLWLKLSNQQLRNAIGLQLGSKICERHKRVCGKDVTEDSYSLLKGK